MKAGLITFTLCALISAVPCHGEKKTRSAGGEVASGTGDIGKGAAKGVGSLAAGTGKGAVNLVTLHPLDAASSVGKGGVVAGIGQRLLDDGLLEGPRVGETLATADHDASVPTTTIRVTPASRAGPTALAST